MNNKKIAYILALCIGLSSTNTFSMTWLKQQLSGATGQVSQYVGSILNTMNEWSAQKTLAVATAAIISLAAFYNKNTIQKWFNNLMSKIPGKSTDKPAESTKHALVSYLQDRQYDPSVIAQLRESYQDPEIIAIIDRELKSHYENKIKLALQTIPLEDRSKWIQNAENILLFEPKQGNQPQQHRTDIKLGSELGMHGTKYQALEKVQPIAKTIFYQEGKAKQTPEEVLLIEH